jgi:hypothetical protein
MTNARYGTPFTIKVRSLVKYEGDDKLRQASDGRTVQFTEQDYLTLVYVSLHVYKEW